MTKIAKKLEAIGVIKPALSPWGSLGVLAGKSNQEFKHWLEYIWRLCINYRKLNQLVQQIMFPIQRCDDAVDHIGRSSYSITFDLATGYWQMPLDPKSRPKTAFFVPDGQKQFTRLPMGLITAMALFSHMMIDLRDQWNAIAEEKGIKIVRLTEELTGDEPTADSKVIVDDVINHSNNVETLLQYFTIVLTVLCFYCVSIELKKTRFFPQEAEFMGMDITKDGNKPAKSKVDGLERLKDNPPKKITDIRSLVGLTGWYRQFVPNFELHVTKLREVIKACKDREGHQGDSEEVGNLWTSEHQHIVNKIVDEIQSRPILQRPNATMRFYLKTD